MKIYYYIPTEKPVQREINMQNTEINKDVIFLFPHHIKRLYHSLRHIFSQQLINSDFITYELMEHLVNSLVNTVDAHCGLEYCRNKNTATNNDNMNNSSNSNNNKNGDSTCNNCDMLLTLLCYCDNNNHDTNSIIPHNNILLHMHLHAIPFPVSKDDHRYITFISCYFINKYFIFCK
jgi:hypothetical protein